MSKSNTKIQISQFNPAGYVGFEPKVESYDKDDGSKGNYYTLNTYYNYGSQEEPNLETLMYEYPEISTDRNGLYRKGPKQGKTGPYYEESVRLIFDHSRPEIQQAINKVREIEKADGSVLHPWRGKMKIPGFDPNNAEATGLKALLQYERDSTTGDIIPGRKPSRFYKVTSATNFLLPKIVKDEHGNHVIDPNTGKPKITYEKLKHEMLVGRQITMIPLIAHTHIYSGGNGKANPQEKIYSAVVTNLKDGGGGEQVETAIHYAEANVDHVANLEEEIAQLRLQLESSNVVKSTVPTTSGADKSSTESFMGGQAQAQVQVVQAPVQVQYQPPQVPNQQAQIQIPPPQVQQEQIAQVQYQAPPSNDNLQATQAQLQAQQQAPPQAAQMPQVQQQVPPTEFTQPQAQAQVQYQPQQPPQYQASATPTQGNVQVNPVPGMPPQQPGTTYL